MSEPLYPVDVVTEEGLQSRVSELIREAALEGVEDELPHSIAVTIDDIVERDDKELIEVYANLFVERDSQKGIIIGHKGSRLAEVGARARAEIESLLGKQVTCPCGSRWPRTGSATRSSWAASASSSAREAAHGRKRASLRSAQPGSGNGSGSAIKSSVPIAQV